MYDRTTVKAVVVGLVANVVRLDNYSLSVMPTVTIAGAATNSRGLTTGNQLDASNQMRGIGAGAELSVFPHARWPVAVHLGAHFVRLTSYRRPSLDGYEPFSEPIDLTRLELGAFLWRPRSPRRSG